MSYEQIFRAFIVVYLLAIYHAEVTWFYFAFLQYRQQRFISGGSHISTSRPCLMSVAGKNKIESIENIQGLSQLKQLDIQSNRLTSLAGLHSLPALEELYLAWNKIASLDDLFSSIYRTDTETESQSKAICSTSALTSSPPDKHSWTSPLPLKSDGDKDAGADNKMDIAYTPPPTPAFFGDEADAKLSNILGHHPDSLSSSSPLPSLNTLDLSNNGLTSLQGIQRIPSLTELWLTSSALSAFEDIKPLLQLPDLQCLYLEHSPISKDYEYRIRISQMIPSLTQLDAILVTHKSGR